LDLSGKILESDISAAHFFAMESAREKNMKTSMRLLFISLLTMGLMAAFAASSSAQPESFSAISDRFGYTGTISVYDSYGDAQSRQNPRYVSIVVPQRDGSIFIVRKMESVWSDFNNIMTNWYSNGGNNPNNNNQGFFQLYDDNASAWQNQKAFWSRDLQTFTVTAKGRNATYPSATVPGDYARLWNSGAPQGSAESTKGTYLAYEYTLTATGLNAADSGGGIYMNTTDATSYVGSFRGIFRNESERYPESNGYYVFDFQFNSKSWATENGYASPDLFATGRINSKVK
jgi:hypothetical protein